MSIFFWSFIYFSAYKYSIPTLLLAWCHILRECTPTPTYYAGNQKNPVFKILKSRREMTKEEREAQITLTLLVKPPHISLICIRPPRSVRHNRASILDSSTDKTLEEDLLADDCGV